MDNIDEQRIFTMAYTVIARRYRSQTFDDVVGQDAIAKTLKNAIQMGRVAHAYLFCGTRGVGKTTLARILAKSLNCLGAESPTVKPCLTCDSCKGINSGEDIDVIEIDGASNRGIDNIRELRQNAMYLPGRARYKIYIIDEVHMLTNEAFNALLKILEEPPAHVKFIFATTEPNRVLPTIQSRCQRFDFQNIHAGVIAQQIEKILHDEKIEYEKDLVIYLSRLANGSMRDALSLLDQLISSGPPPLTLERLNLMLGTPDRQKMVNLLTAMGRQDGAGVLEAIEHLLSGGQNAVQICDLVVESMRDLMVFVAAGPDSPALSLTEDEKKQLAQLAQDFDIAALVYSITALEKLRYALKTTETNRALLEAAMLRLTLSEHFIGLDQLAGRPNEAPSQTPLKKKPIDFSPSPQPQAAVPNAPVDAGSIGHNLASIQSHWGSVAAQCGRSDSGLESFLKQGAAAAFDGSLLTIRFKQGFAREMCERKAAKIEQEISQILGTAIKTKFELGAVDIPAPAAGRDNPASAIANRRQQNEALNDPAVQMVLKGLDATPVDIQKMSRDEEETPKENLFEEDN